MLIELPDMSILYTIAAHLKSDGYETNVENNSLRIGYYKKMPDKYYTLYKGIIVEDVDEDEDVGRLYSYRSKV